MVLFDLDGTLWDSSAQVAESWNQVMKKQAFSAADIRGVMGKTMEEIARTLMPDMDPAVRDPLFKTCETYEVEYIKEHGGKLYEDVEETLKQLQEEGFRLAVVSNCQTGYVKAFLTSMNMEQYFCDYEEWGRTGLSKAQNIRLVMERNQCGEAVYVGDTEMDGQAAKLARIPFIWASYGFGDVREYDAKLDSFRQLPALLKRLFPAGVNNRNEE